MLKTAFAHLIDNFPELALFIIAIAISSQLIKWLISLRTENHRMKFEQIKSANSIIKSNLHRPSKKQRYLTEQLFESMYKIRFEYDEIIALLNTNSPSKAISLYIKTDDHLQLSDSKKTFTFKKEPRSIRFLGKKYYVGGIKAFVRYMIYAGLAVLSGAISYNFFTKNFPPPDSILLGTIFWVVLFAFGTLAFAWNAFESIGKGESVKYANRFIEQYGSTNK